MAGLTSTYINNKLATEGTTNATRQLILSFLNGAASSAMRQMAKGLGPPGFELREL